MSVPLDGAPDAIERLILSAPLGQLGMTQESVVPLTAGVPAVRPPTSENLLFSSHVSVPFVLSLATR